MLSVAEGNGEMPFTIRQMKLGNVPRDAGFALVGRSCDVRPMLGYVTKLDEVCVCR